MLPSSRVTTRSVVYSPALPAQPRAGVGWGGVGGKGPARGQKGKTCKESGEKVIMGRRSHLQLAWRQGDGTDDPGGPRPEGEGWKGVAKPGSAKKECSFLPGGQGGPREVE